MGLFRHRSYIIAQHCYYDYSLDLLSTCTHIYERLQVKQNEIGITAWGRSY